MTASLRNLVLDLNASNGLQAETGSGAGSVAVANGHAAVYPAASPGGWQLVGRTGFSLFSAREPPYATLAPGDRVRFTVANAAGDEAAVGDASGGKRRPVRC